MFNRAVFVMVVIALLMSVRGVAIASEEEDAPESAVSSPPMEMDDPGTPGKQGIEVNLVGTLLRAGSGRGSETLLDANFGIGDRIQLKLERPYLTQWARGLPYQEGLGATELGVKWRFIDHNGLEVAAYPQYEFNDGPTPRDEDGNPEDKAGSAFLIPLLLSKTLNHFYTLAANVAYRRNLENLGDDLNVALGAGRSVGGHGRVLAEVFSERTTHFKNRQTDVRVGWAGTMFPGWFAHSQLELGEFASLGHSIGATEAGEPSTSMTFGVSFVKAPKE